MKLEDFFNQTEPENYVQPLKKTPTLEQFFSERVPTQKAKDIGTVKTVASDTNMSAKAAADSAPKLSDEDVDRLAMQANPSLGLQMQQTALQKTQLTEPEIPSTDRFTEVNKLIEEMKSKKPEGSFTDLGLGLIPLGIDVLFGKGKGYALPASADYYMGKTKDIEGQKKTLEARLFELQKLKALKSMEIPKTAKGLTFEQRQQLQNEKLDASINREERKIRLETRDKVMSNKEYGAARASYESANTAIDVLNGKTWAGDAGIPSLFAKGIFKEAGAMSDQDKAVFVSNPALLNKYNSIWAKYLDPSGGTFSDDDRKVLMEVAIGIRERAKKDASAVAGGYIQGLRSEGIDPSKVVSPLIQFRDVSPKKEILNFGKINDPGFEKWKAERLKSRGR